MLVDKFISYIEAEKRYSPLTVKAYRRDLDEFAAYLVEEYEIKDLSQVTAPFVKSFLVSLKDGGQ